MVSTDYLFRLIKSLNKNEKRYIKLLLTAQKGNKTHVLLFNTLDSQKTHDETKLEKKLRTHYTSKQLAVAKNRLYNTILKNLVTYHAERTIESGVREAINQIEVLYCKNLFKPCLKIIQREKKICYASQKYSLLLYLLEWERNISYFNEDGFLPLRNCTEEIKTVLFKITVTDKYKELFIEFWTFTIKKGKLSGLNEKKELHTLFNNPLLKEEPKHIGWEAQWFYAWMHFCYNRILGNYSKAYKAVKQMLSLFDQVPHLMTENPNRYVSTLTNIAQVCEELKRVKECISYTTRIKKFVESRSISFYTHIRIRSYCRAYYVELTLYARHGYIKEALDLVPAIEKHLMAYSKELSMYTKVFMYFEIANLYFISNDLKKALFWVNNTLATINHGLDLQPAARILNILIHYELKNSDTLEALIASTEQFLKRNSRLYDYERVVLANLKRLHFSKNKVNEKRITDELAAVFQQFLKTDYGKTAAQFLDIELWIKSKRQNRTMREIIQKKINKADKTI